MASAGFRNWIMHTGGPLSFLAEGHHPTSEQYSLGKQQTLVWLLRRHQVLGTAGTLGSTRALRGEGSPLPLAGPSALWLHVPAAHACLIRPFRDVLVLHPWNLGGCRARGKTRGATVGRRRGQPSKLTAPRVLAVGQATGEPGCHRDRGGEQGPLGLALQLPSRALLSPLRARTIIPGNITGLATVISLGSDNDRTVRMIHFEFFNTKTMLNSTCRLADL